jgi:glutamate synthase (NADPH/NADH) large chain
LGRISTRCGRHPPGQSDTASLDNALELLLAGGYSLAHAMMMLMPEAWAGNPLMDAKRRAFYEYHAALMEPWDGPAGRLHRWPPDRRHARPQRSAPARFSITRDDLCAWPRKAACCRREEDIVRKWRLQPGRMLLIDLERAHHRGRGRPSSPRPSPTRNGSTRRSTSSRIWKCRP